jgi:hypothetical protein
MFETLTITTILLTLFFFWQNQRLGLTSTVPKDPANRMEFYCSECLVKLKTLLPKSRVESVQAHALTFRPPQDKSPQELRVEAGKVKLGPQTLGFLGDQGELSFEKLSETGLLVTVLARSAEASHKAALRVEVEFA